LSLWLQARLGQRQDVVPTSALDQLHRPAMLGGITLDLFPEIESLGYGLGCQVESYRGRRIVHHGGNITGFSSDVCVVPGSAVGIAVLTNLDGSYLRLPLLYGILDRLLGLDPIAWGERIHDVETSLKRGHAEALRHHQSVSKPAPPSRALSDFVGAYEHPAYGRLSVSAAEDLLMPEFHGVADQIRLRHRGHDAWDLLFTEADLACPLVFRQDSDGNVIGCSIALEPSVQPITFARVPPQAKDEFVDALVGRYTMGPHALVVRRRGNEIVASTPAVGELLLVSQGDDRFSCPTMPGVVITAERTPTDGVARVVVDGVGVFVRDAE
jgi:hypothetical protein